MFKDKDPSFTIYEKGLIAIIFDHFYLFSQLKTNIFSWRLLQRSSGETGNYFNKENKQWRFIFFIGKTIKNFQIHELLKLFLCILNNGSLPLNIPICFGTVSVKFDPVFMYKILD